MKYCTLCGVPFTRSLNEAWIENVRAVWIEGTSWNRTAVSGVGRWGEYDDDPCVPVPADRQTRYDSHSGPGPTIEMGLTPSNPTVYLNPDVADEPWGYGFHESCWSIFTKNYKPNLDVLFAACLSMPTDTNTLLDWGHGYAGASSVKQQLDMPIRSSCFRSLEAIPQTFRSDPYHVPGLVNAINGAARLQNDFLSQLEPTVQSLQSDSFSRLVPELLQAIVIHLPTSDVRSLRLASPVFATLELSERFWASRFQPGHEFEHLPGVHDRPPESWRVLYLSLKIWARGISRQMSVSFVDTAAGRFISGFNMIDEHDRSHALGYQHGNVMWRISLPLDEPIQGWELAMDLSGIKRIAAVQSDGKLTSWAGESAGLPRWRLKEAQGVSAVKAEFDALKLVSISRDKLPN
ncbi:uncharacterized protein FRV6_00769 [Fusarium oxysporum]|uniref:DUF7600 domain-containing protein n=1 Tax=Fusarium oxysporum TaxID=5507 RepID=A0A2H3SJ99_FUSOX|nr:uncharacterized protein FRV6_00769 [Fusarium oxysporum]